MSAKKKSTMPAKSKKKVAKSKKTRPMSRREYKKKQKTDELQKLGVIPTSLDLAKGVGRFMRDNRALIGKMFLTYLLLYFVLARSTPQFNIADVSDYVRTESPEDSDFSRATFILDVIAAESTNSSLGIMYGLILLVIVSLALLWTLRARGVNEKPKARDGFYRGMNGIIPFVLVGFLMVLQMVPFAIGAVIYSAAVGGVAVVGVAEQIFFVALWVVLSLPSLYWLSTSMIALNIASIPGYYPMQAVEAAKELVGVRRVVVIRRMIGGFLIFGSIMLALMLFSIVVIPDFAYVMRDLVLVSIPFVYTIYMYKLYKSLIN